jgi:molybdopterin-biosynthesis enzyme MoeA-like protein
VEAVSAAIGRGSVVDEPTLADYVCRRNLAGIHEVSPGLRKMATVPEGAQVFPNPAGWAPFSVLATGDASLLILPGPPKEMEAVFSMYGEDLIASRTAMKSAALRVVVEMFESEVSPLLSEVMNRLPNTYLKAYVALREGFGGGLPVDLVAAGATTEAAHARLREALGIFTELVTARGRQIEYLSEGDGVT